MTAVDAETGDVKWEAFFPAESGEPTEIIGDFFYSTPALSADGSRIYIGGGAERDELDSFFSIDAETGEVQWEFVLDLDDDEIFGCRGFPFTVSQGMVASGLLFRSASR